ncbi:methyltransferase domain-containing protein [Bacillus marinisedimentorum]|uniref:methyltransferase domain-containing protein n=1 Tax=Bacillus marinisedimentorum TaxID=1821260 RepID=UPI0007E16E11|nr:methyltransferase domain-containing protein [Bacillus marinisedimentorum]
MAQEFFLNPPLADIIEQWKAYFNLLDIAPGQSVLDIGCNTGDAEHLLLGVYPFVDKAVGLDNSEARIIRARQNWEDKGRNARIEFVVGDAMALPFPDNSFDRVICAEVLEWVAEPEKAIEEMYRVLKPGGKAAVIHTDFDTQVFSTENPGRTRKIIHAFADSGPDGIIGRKLSGMIGNSSFSKVESHIHTLINREFNKYTYSYSMARMMRHWLAEENMFELYELGDWLDELKRMHRSGSFYYSVNRNICTGWKPGQAGAR